jgi:membrane protease YdiL (CAAX protease family)
MSIPEATLWGIGSVVAFGLLLQAAKKLVPDLEHDIPGSSLCQVIAYLALLWVVQTVYFPRTRLAVIFATRPGSWVFYPIAILLGLAIHIPTNAIYEAALARWPDTSAAEVIMKGFSDLPAWRKVATGVGLVLTTPLIEEAFFRGALFGTLRRHHAPVIAVVTTAAIFGFVHIQPQAFLPIGIVGAALAFMRMASGSLWPGVVLHMTFNGLTFYAMAQGSADAVEPAETMPVWLVVVGTAVTGGLLALADVLRKRYGEPLPEMPESKEEEP